MSDNAGCPSIGRLLYVIKYILPDAESRDEHDAI